MTHLQVTKRDAAFWVAWLLLLLYRELPAVANRREGDTLSEFVWWTQQNRLVRASQAALWGWLTFHFFVEPLEKQRRWHE